MHGQGFAKSHGQAQRVGVCTKQRRHDKYLESRSLRGSVLEIGLFSNKWTYVGIAAILILQLGSAPLGLAASAASVQAALIVLPVVWIDKWRQRRHSRRKPSEKAG